MSRFEQLAFTEGVQAHQRQHGSDRAYRRMLNGPQEADVLGPNEAAFIGERESFYMATVGETGWPYIQHRGGPPGFVRVLNEHTIGFPDFRGNRQYISRGNLDHDNRVSLFFMDYVHRVRLKLLGRARVLEDDQSLTVAGYPAKVERAMLIDVEGLSWNCPQHIPQMFPRDAVDLAIKSLRDRVTELERENASLRGRQA